MYLGGHLREPAPQLSGSVSPGEVLGSFYLSLVLRRDFC